MDETILSEKLINACQVAEILGISETQAYRIMQIGILPSVRFGKIVRCRPRDLEAFIEENKQKKVKTVNQPNNGGNNG